MICLQIIVPSHGLELKHVHELIVAAEAMLFISKSPCCSFPNFVAVHERSAPAGTGVFRDWFGTIVPLLQGMTWGPMANLTGAQVGIPHWPLRRSVRG